MNTIIRLMTMSFMVSAFVVGIAGYAVTSSGGAVFTQTVEDLEEGCFGAVRHIGAFADILANSEVVNPYYGLAAVPPPMCSEGENMRPF